MPAKRADSSLGVKSTIAIYSFSTCFGGGIIIKAGTKPLGGEKLQTKFQGK